MAARITVNVVWRSQTKTYVLRWNDGIRWQQQSTKLKRRRKDAERARQMAAELEAELSNELASFSDWEGFCDLFESSHMAGLSEKSRQGWATTRNLIDEHLKPARVADLKPATLALFMSKLSGSAATIKTRMAWLRAALRWAELMGVIERSPRVPMPKGGGQGSMKRAVTEDELHRILSAAYRARPDDWLEWQRLLLGLWHSGMRVSELLQLSWDQPPYTLSRPDGKPARIQFSPKQKNRKQQVVPVTPEFWLLASRQNTRIPGDSGGNSSHTASGLVFPVHVGTKAAIKIIGQFGKSAGVITDPSTGRTATSTDIGRRAFASRMASIMSPMQLTAWLRHSSVETTSRAYYRESPDSLAEGIWGSEGEN